MRNLVFESPVNSASFSLNAFKNFSVLVYCSLIPVFLAVDLLGFILFRFPGGSDGKASACSAGDPGLTPGSGRSPGEGNGDPLQFSCLENPMDGGAW